MSLCFTGPRVEGVPGLGRLGIALAVGLVCLGVEERVELALVGQLDLGEPACARGREKGASFCQQQWWEVHVGLWIGSGWEGAGLGLGARLRARAAWAWGWAVR